MGFLIKNLSCGYERAILKNIDMEYRKDMWHFIVGTTGTGKSTFLQTLSKLREPLGGEVFYLGESLNKKEGLKKFRDDSGIMFQYTDKQFFNHTIREEILFNLKKREKNKDKREIKLKEIMQFLNLSENILERSPFELSGGQKRMVALASIIITDPSILILDEPTVGLDIESKELFFSVIKKLRERGVTVFQISHFMEDVIQYGDSVTILSNGEIRYYPKTDILLDEVTLEKAGLEPPEIVSITKIFRKWGYKKNPSNVMELIQGIREDKHGKI
ncbi:MAG: ATP-binding cassette domain-containing protein [Fusobacteriaceae bacterium]